MGLDFGLLSTLAKIKFKPQAEGYHNFLDAKNLQFQSVSRQEGIFISAIFLVYLTHYACSKHASFFPLNKDLIR